MEASEAAKNALELVLEASNSEKILIVCDEQKSKIGDAFARGALTLGLWTKLEILRKQTANRNSGPYRESFGSKTRHLH